MIDLTSKRPAARRTAARRTAARRRVADRTVSPAALSVVLSLFLCGIVPGLGASAGAAERDAERDAGTDLGAGNDDANDLYARIGGTAAREVHRPASAVFAKAARELERATDALCETPGAGPLAATRDAFARTVVGFSALELLRVGPLMEDNRLNRLFYWPDKRSAGERQLRALLLADDAADIAPDSMSSRSVSVQGLPALERLLYADAAGMLAERANEGDAAPGATRCAVAHAIAGNVATLAGEIERGWSGEDGIVRQMSAPRAGDPLFRDSNEIIRSLLTQLESGVESLVERKLGPALATDPSTRRGMPFRLSALVAENLAGNVESLRALAIDSGLARQAGLEKELAFELRVASGHAARLIELQPVTPLPNALDAEERGVMQALSSTLTSIGNTVLERLSPTLGVRTGFNAQDGD